MIQIALSFSALSFLNTENQDDVHQKFNIHYGVSMTIQYLSKYNQLNQEVRSNLLFLIGNLTSTKQGMYRQVYINNKIDMILVQEILPMIENDSIFYEYNSQQDCKQDIFQNLIWIISNFCYELEQIQFLTVMERFHNIGITLIKCLKSTDDGIILELLSSIYLIMQQNMGFKFTQNTQQYLFIKKTIELGFFNVLRGLLISPICQYINPVEKVIFEYQDDQGLKNYDNLNNNNEVFDESKQMNQDQNTYLTQQQNNHANFKKFNSRILKQILITYELFFEKCPDEFKSEIYDSQLIKIIKSNVINQSHQSLRQHSIRLLLLLVKQKPEQIIEICLQQKIFKILISNGQKEDQIVKKSILLLFKNVICKYAKPNQVYRLVLEFNLFSLLNYFLDQDTLVNLLYDTLIITEKIFQIGFQYYFNQITKTNQFIDEFESKFNSQIFEQLQFHKNDHIYQKSLAIVEQFFDKENQYIQDLQN